MEIIAGSGRYKRLWASIKPAAADNGKQGSIFVAGLVPQLGWYFLTPGGFVSWTGGEMPAYYSGLLQDTTLSILDGSMDLLDYLGTDFYIGYGSSADEMLRARRYIKGSTVQGLPRR